MEVFLFYDFLEVMLKRNEKVRKAYYYLSIILLSLFIFILTQIKIYSMIRTILLFIIFLLIGYKLFKGNVKGKVFFTTMFYLFLLFSDVLAVYILSYSTGKDIKNIVINQTWARVLFSQISKLLLLITLRMVKNNYKEREPDIPKYYWYWILLVYIISGINLLAIFNVSLIANDLSIKIQYLIVAISIGSLLIVIITYYVFTKLNCFYKDRNNYRIVKIKNEMLISEMKEKERIYEDVRKLQHDFKNHIICIEKLLEQGKVESANEYINGLKGEVSKTCMWIKTGNDIVDIILNRKNLEGNKKNIKMDMKVNIPKDINIQS
jgi:hypothetical protein